MKQLTILFFLILSFYQYAISQSNKIVNIVNFIRLLEPRDSAITQDVLYQTVVEQIKLMRAHHLPGTFLLQYDALMNSRYQTLLKNLPRDSFEIGAWWEIPQPLVENSGMTWRGRYPWDWRANIGFSTGYTPAEREKLIDTYMKDFHAAFGYYPRSVASWFIDARSLQYMYNKYHIVASANCKDQYGTDGYTLWGGYWNGAYYPSKTNAYMPAQHKEKQIPVPIFRMLGSDPVRQYDDALSSARQGVVTLEPVYPAAGGDSTWIHWFFDQFVNGASGALAYAQAGQENSFTWNAMAKGLQMQFPLIETLRNEGKIKVETLASSGEWFSSQFPLTPAAAVTVTQDLPGSDKKTVWYNSRFYRANLLWEGGSLRFRDIHLFSENLPSRYEKEVATTNDCEFYTLPLVDGYLWSDSSFFAGLRFTALVNGKETEIRGGTPTVSDSVPGKLLIHWPMQGAPGRFVIECEENHLSIALQGNTSLHWMLAFNAAKGKNLPFTDVSGNAVNASFEGMKYSLVADGATVVKGEKDAFRIQPKGMKMVLQFEVK